MVKIIKNGKGIVGAGVGFDAEEIIKGKKSYKKELSNIELDVKIKRLQKPLGKKFQDIFNVILRKQLGLIQIGENYGLNDFNTRTLHKEITKIKKLKKEMGSMMNIYFEGSFENGNF
jgi:DNA-directed RNA polymerase specialized sigma subunit